MPLSQNLQNPLTLWSQLSPELLWAWEGALPPNWRNGVYRSREIVAWWIQEGSVRMEIGDDEIRAKAGQWLLPRPGVGWQEFSQNAKILSVRFRAIWPDGQSIVDIARDLVLSAEDWPELGRTGRALVRLVRSRLTDNIMGVMQTPCTLATYLNLVSCLSRWLLSYYEAVTAAGLKPIATGVTDPHVINAVQVLQSQSFSQPVCEPDLARMVGISVSQLNRLFVSELGVTPRRWAENRRLQAAEWALSSSHASIKEIAFSLGFSSSAHFCTWFRRHRHDTPTGFRTQSHPPA